MITDKDVSLRSSDDKLTHIPHHIKNPATKTAVMRHLCLVKRSSLITGGIRVTLFNVVFPASEDSKEDDGHRQQSGDICETISTLR